MANMTIENIGGFMQSGNLDRVLDNGRSVEGPIPAQAELPGGDAAGVKSFGEMLNQSLEKVNEAQANADRAVKELVAGRNKNIHETMLAMEKADMSFKLAMQVRNKVIEAYKEIMRMQV